MTLRPLAFLFGFALLALQGCSTALSIDPQVEDEPEPGRDAAAVDAGRADAGQTDAGRVPTDAAGIVDSGRVSVEAGSSNQGSPHDCTLLPTRGVASLLTDDCLERRVTPCRGQADLDSALSLAAATCGADKPPVDLGFTLDKNGCPGQLRYEQARILGAISACLQAELEDLRFGCRLDCAIVHVANLR